jgi:hypothetical protein
LVGGRRSAALLGDAGSQAGAFPTAGNHASSHRRKHFRQQQQQQQQQQRI